MTDPFVLPKDLLHEVVLRTIELDNLSNQIIRVALGLDLKWGGKYESELLNQKELNRFKTFFLDNLGSSSRAELLSEIVEDIDKSKKEKFTECKNFRNKLIDFYKIRNIFAHNYYPKDLKGMTRLESVEPHWIPLNTQHKELKAFLFQLI